MAGTYARYSPFGVEGGGGGEGITSINGDTTPAQEIVGGTGISVSTVAGSTTITNTESPGNAFTIVQTDTGTFPTATTPTSTLTLHNSDGTLSILGNSTTNTVTLDTVGLQPSGNYITALTGDVSAAGPGSAAATLATVNSTTGTFLYPQITVNGKGLVTAASTPAQASNEVFAGPVSGAASTPTFRSLVLADIPNLPYLTSINGDTTQAQTIAAGTGISISTVTGTTTVTNTSPASSLTFADSLVNTSGTVTLVGDSLSPGTTLYYGTNGAGTKGFFSLPGSSGANQALSNLSAVAINTSLLPTSNNSIDLGSSSLDWAHLYIGTQILAPLITGLGATGAAITVRGGLAASGGPGGAVTIAGAAGDSANGAGGNLTLNGGNAGGAGGTNESGGAISIVAGTSVGSATGGTVTISSATGGAGTGTAGATGGTTNINGGNGGVGSATSGNGGGATLKGGSGGGGATAGSGGIAQLTGGTGGTGSASGGTGGAANVQGGSPGSFAGAAGGPVTIAAGNGSGTGSGGAGGSVTITTGTAGGDNTANESGGSFTVSVGHSIGSSGGAAIQVTAGTGGIGTSTAGASGGNATFTAGSGGVGSATGGSGGNLIVQGGAGGNSGTPGTGGFIQFQTASTTSLTEKMRILAAGGVNVVNGALNVTTAGNGLAIAHGSNCKLGTATLSAGTVTVTNNTITSNSLIFLTVQTLGTVSVPSAVAATAKSVGTSFTITSSVITDTSTVAWMIVEQL